MKLEETEITIAPLHFSFHTYEEFVIGDYIQLGEYVFYVIDVMTYPQKHGSKSMCKVETRSSIPTLDVPAKRLKVKGST